MADLDDFDVDDLNFHELRERSPQQNKRKHGDTGLGIDEEVSVAKRPRAPAVKLDEARLLSDKGITRLRRRARNLGLKGKGHEFSDAAHLLEFYQDWLDGLFPKAKFLDALAMVEKLGHKKLIRKQRIDWINEGKPQDVQAVYDGAPAPAAGSDDTATKPGKLAPVFDAHKDTNEPGTMENVQRPSGDDAAVQELTPRVGRASLEEQGRPMMSGGLGGASRSIFGPTPREKTPTSPAVDVADDELDALMAEAGVASLSDKDNEGKSKNISDNDFADEEAAMAEMEGLF